MKAKRTAILVIVMILLLGIISVDAASPSSLTANLPFTTGVVDSIEDGDVGTHVSITHHPVKGTAYMSYYDATNGDLIMAHEVAPGTGNCTENPNWDCEIVYGTGNVGKYSSIDVEWVYDFLYSRWYTKIGISFFDDTNDSLKYAQYHFMTGWTIWEVDDHPGSIPGGGSRGTYSSLKFNTNYVPIIAYHSVTNLLSIGGVKIAEYNPLGNGSGCDGDDSDYWNCQNIDVLSEHSNYGTHVSLDIDYSDVVNVAFYDSFNSELVWAYYQGFGGSCSNTEWNCITVDGAGDVGKFVSLHAPISATDKMRLAYFDGTVTGKIKYAVRVSSGGNCTSSVFDCFDVDTIGNPIVPIGLSITVDQHEQPVIAYMDASNQFTATRLNIARPAAAYGNEVGNCGETPPGYLFLYWQCETIDKGYQDIVNEAYYADVSVRPEGLVSIAYYESDTYNLEGRVKVAQQHFMIFMPIIIK